MHGDPSSSSGPDHAGRSDDGRDPRRGRPLHLDEPRLTLPTGPILLAALAGAALIAALWAGAGALLGRPVWIAAGLAGAPVVVLAAVATTLITVPWLPKPASTAGLVWIAGTALRGVASAALGFLLYSAPPFGWSEDLAKGAAPFLLAVATGYLVVLLLEVAVIARHVLRATPA